MKNELNKAFLVGAGGVIGALMRHTTNLWHQAAFETPGIFTAVFIENIAGSFLMGFFFLLLLKRSELNTRISLFLLTGLLGSYTTYSGFMTEALLLLEQSFPLYLAYMAAQLVTGIFAVVAGIKTAHFVRSVIKR